MSAAFSEEVIIQGDVFRGSSAVNDVVNWRYGRLTTGGFYTFRAKPDPETQKPAPTKAWGLSPRCSVGEAAERSCFLKDRHTSTVWAVAARKGKGLRCTTFTVTWPKGKSEQALLLAFEDAATAAQWQQAFRDAIGLQKPEKQVSGASVAATSQHSGDLDPDSMYRHVPVEGAPPMYRESAPELPPRGGHHSRNASISSISNWVNSTGVLPRVLEGDLEHPERVWQMPEQLWASYRHINGVAVYQEAERPGEETGGAFMVSAVVRAAPADAYKALIEGFVDLPMAGNLKVLEQSERNSRLVLCKFTPPGTLLPAFVTPRYTVLQQSWREDEDGSLVFLMHSAPAPNLPPEPASWRKWPHVEAVVQAAGFTISPLQQRYLSGKGASSECLVTFVLKVDLGGWLSPKSWLGALIQGSVGGFMGEAAADVVVALRDKVEQDRFLVKPFTMGQQLRAQHPGFAAGLPSPSQPEDGDARGLSARRESRESGRGEGGEAPPLETTLDHRFWANPGSAGYKVRGANYLSDKKKVAAGEPEFRLVTVDLVELAEPTPHVAQYLPSIRDSREAFTFCVQLMLPGPPHLALVTSWAAPAPEQLESALGGQGAGLSQPGTPKQGAHPRSIPEEGDLDAMTFESADSEAEVDERPFHVCLARFLSGEGPEALQRRQRTFKLIPSVVEGSWVIKQGVGNTPVLVGRKVTAHFNRGPRYFEVDIDVGSSRAAASVMGLVSQSAKSLTLDLGIIIEGSSPEELPEALLGTIRFQKVDLASGVFLDKATGELRPRLPRGAARAEAKKRQ